MGHHWVPAAHLARFSYEAPTAKRPRRKLRVVALDVKTGAITHLSADQVAQRDGLYRVVAVDGPTDHYEKWKGRLESDALAVGDRLAAAPRGQLQLPEDERIIMALYIGLLHAQHPDVLRATHEAATELANEFEPGTHSDEVLWHQTLAEWMDGGMTKIAMGVGSYRWSVALRPEPPHFVIGDAPLVLMEDRYSGLPGVGWLGGLALPLRPEAAVIAFRDQEIDEQVYVMDAEEIGAINHAAFMQSSRHVIARSEDDLNELRAGVARRERWHAKRGGP